MPPIFVAKISSGDAAQIQEGRRRVNAHRHPQEVQRQTMAETVLQGRLYQGEPAPRVLLPPSLATWCYPLIEHPPSAGIRADAAAKVCFYAL